MNYVCTSCGHQERRARHNGFMTAAIDCPQCGKWTFIVVNTFPIKEFITPDQAINATNWDKTSTWKTLALAHQVEKG